MSLQEIKSINSMEEADSDGSDGHDDVKDFISEPKSSDDETIILRVKDDSMVSNFFDIIFISFLIGISYEILMMSIKENRVIINKVEWVIAMFLSILNPIRKVSQIIDIYLRNKRMYWSITLLAVNMLIINGHSASMITACIINIIVHTIFRFSSYSPIQCFLILSFLLIYNDHTYFAYIWIFLNCIGNSSRSQRIRILHAGRLRYYRAKTILMLVILSIREAYAMNEQPDKMILVPNDLIIWAMYLGGSISIMVILVKKYKWISGVLYCFGKIISDLWLCMKCKHREIQIQDQKLDELNSTKDEHTPLIKKDGKNEMINTYEF